MKPRIHGRALAFDGAWYPVTVVRRDGRAVATWLGGDVAESVQIELCSHCYRWLTREAMEDLKASGYARVGLTRACPAKEQAP
jgi:hypothetical protein